MLKPRLMSRASSLTPLESAEKTATWKGQSQPAGLLTHEDTVGKAPGDVRMPARTMVYLSNHSYEPKGA